LHRAGCPHGGFQEVKLAYSAFDVRALYRVREGLRLGLMAKNLYGKFSNEGYERYAFPRYVTLGIASEMGAYIFSLDTEVIFGGFGREKDNVAQFWFVRGGVESELGSRFTVRVGLLYPMVAYTSTAGDMRGYMPSPKIGGAAGIGAKFGRIAIDFAVYGDPARSYVDEERAVSSGGTDRRDRDS
jgi:hypothetical protein